MVERPFEESEEEHIRDHIDLFDKFPSEIKTDTKASDKDAERFAINSDNAPIISENVCESVVNSVNQSSIYI